MTNPNDSTTASAIPRRGFLRQLCALPLIGGGVMLIGRPSAAAVPVTPDLLDGYDEWLFHERRMLHIERFGKEAAVQSVAHVPCSFAGAFHFPTMGDRKARPPWMDVPVPSSRAALVLSAVGCPITGGAHG